MTTTQSSPELMDWLQDEARTLRVIRKAVLNELQRVHRVVAKRGMTGEQALAYTKTEITELFKLELKARRVSA